MSNPSAEDELDPAAAHIVAKVRWLMLISAATTGLAIAAVIGVIGYRVFRAEGSTPAEVTALLPKGARVVSTALGEDRIVVTLEDRAVIAGHMAWRLDHSHLRRMHNHGTHSVCSPPPCGEGLGVGVLQRITTRPPPRRFAPTLPTKGRVETEFAARAESTSPECVLT